MLSSALVAVLLIAVAGIVIGLNISTLNLITFGLSIRLYQFRVPFLSLKLHSKTQIWC